MLSNIKKFNLLAIFSIWRLLAFIPLIIGTYLIPYNPAFPIAYIFNYINADISPQSVFLSPWANFDGIHYLNIATHGYTNQARFFPLFPLLISFLSSKLLVSIIFVNILFILALFVFKKLVELDFPKEISIKTIIYLLIFPASFFFVAIYSEGLFLLLTLLTFYFARKRRWILAMLCAMFVMTTRFVGIAVLPALLYEYFISEESLWATIRGGLNQYKKLALFLLTPLGLLAYSVFNYYKWHNFLYFIQAQGELGNNRTVAGIVLFPQTIFRYIKILSTVPVSSYDWAMALLELASFLFVSLLLYFAWKKKIRKSYLIFAFISYAIIISTGTFSALPRYVITLFPIFIALATIRNKAFKFAYIVISPILFFVLLMLFSRGYFIA